MTFSDFPIPPDWPAYLHNSLVAKYVKKGGFVSFCTINLVSSYRSQTHFHSCSNTRYFDMYAEHFNLSPHIKFNSTVTNVSILPDKRWRIKYVIRGEKEDEEKEDIFDYVMVCTGHHRYHRWPKYKGM